MIMIRQDLKVKIKMKLKNLVRTKINQRMIIKNSLMKIIRMKLKISSMKIQNLNKIKIINKMTYQTYMMKITIKIMIYRLKLIMKMTRKKKNKTLRIIWN